MKLKIRIAKKSWIFIGLLFPCGLLAQENGDLRLDEIIELKRVEYENQGLPQENIEKKLGKFEAYWNPRLAEDGTLGRMTAVFPERGEEKSGGVYCETDFASWRLEGPVVYDGPSKSDFQVGFDHKQWNGLMTEICPAADESFILAAAEKGGIWRRVAGEPGWTNVTDAMNLPYMVFNSIVANPYNQDEIFASSGGDFGAGGIIKSIDGGLTWSVLTSFQTDYCAEFPAICAGGNESFIDTRNLLIDEYNSTGSTNLHLYVITETDWSGSDIWKSTDSGLTWIHLRDASLTFPAPTLVANNSWTYVRVDDLGNLFATTNYSYGADAKYWKFNPVTGWSDLTDNIRISPGLDLSFRFSTPQGSTIYAVRDRLGPDERAILVSNDRGFTWSFIADIPPVGTWWGGIQAKNEFEYYPETGLIYLGANRLWSIDPVSAAVTDIHQGHVDIRDIYLSGGPGNYLLYTANDGGVSKVGLTAGTWEDISGTNLPVLSFADIGVANISAPRYLGGVGHNHAKVLSNGVWKHFSGGDGDAGIIHPSNPDLGYFVAKNAKVYKYDFVTNTENSLSISSAFVGGAWFNAHIQIHPRETNLVYYTNDKGTGGLNHIGVYNESTGGPWSYQELLHDMKRPGEIGIGTDDAARVYVASYGASGSADLYGLIRSDDWGNTGSWTSIGATDVYDETGTTVIGTLNEALSNKFITDIEVDPYDAEHLWISISGFMKEDETDRVLVSYNGGDSWREFSQGLSRYPVHSIILIPNTNGLMFAGTESGVFYRDNSMSEWTCFNNGMPYCIISDLDYNTCTGELVAATYGRGIWKSSIPHSEQPITYVSNTIIPLGTLKFDTDIVIKAPAIVTVLGTVEMANDRRITVEPGATLIVDGGTITNQCDYLWDGIYLGGDITQPQLTDIYITDPNQATFFLKNNGTIEHCGGVTTQAYDAGYDHGARVFSTNGNFVDNRNDVFLLSYPNDNVSYFRETNFLTTAPLGDPDYEDVHGRLLGTQVHVNMWEVNGVEFEKNIFANTGSFDQDIRGTGILSLDSELKVNGLCLSVEGDGSCENAQLSFDRLAIGIDFRSTTSNHDLWVTKNEFESTVQGITVTGASDVYVHDNYFLNYNGSDDVGAIDFMKSWGVYLTNTRTANLLDNHFLDGATNAPVGLDYYTRGIIVYNTGNTIMNIRKNTFHEGEMIAIHAWQNNEGVQTNCNDFYSEYGIYVDRPEVGVSLFPTQGSVENPTGNSFFYPCSDNTHHIYFDGIDPISPWHTILDYHTYIGTPFLPTCISNDWNTFSYFNPSNLAPGYVRTFESETFNSEDCDLWQEVQDDKELKRSQEISERDEVLTSELAEIESSSTNTSDFLAELVETSWLAKTDNGEFLPGRKYKELAVLRQQLLQIDRNLGNQLKRLVLEGNTSEAEEYLEGASSWSKLSYVEACMEMNLDFKIDLDELPQDYDIFYEVIVELKNGNRSIYQITADERGKLSRIALHQTPAGTKAAALLSFIDGKQYTPYVDEFDVNRLTEKEMNEFNQEAIQVYPNPADDLVNIKIDANFNAISLLIFNMLGEEVYSSNPKANQSVDVSRWEKGVYIITIASQNENKIVKFVVN